MKTNYVIAVDLGEEEYSEYICLLGWDKYDCWFDATYSLCDIIKNGKLVDNEGSMIEITDIASVYASNEADSLRPQLEKAISRGINATLIKVEIINGEISAIPQ